MTKIIKAPSLIVSLLSIFLLTSCMVGPNFRSPPSPPTHKYTAKPLPKRTASTSGPGGQSQRLIMGQDIPAEWWKLFHSPTLNCLIVQGLANNPNVAAAKSALTVAHENVNAAIGSLLYPNVNAQFLAQRQKFSAAIFGVGSAGGDGSTAFTGTNIFNFFNPVLNLSYTLDVWGGSRRQIESLQAQVDYQRFLLEAAHLTLASNIAVTAITEASLRAQIEATHEIIKLMEAQLVIVQNQFTLGAVSQVDVLTQQTQLAQTRATLPPLEQSLAKAQHGLAALVGILPGQDNLPRLKLDELHLPRNIPISLPSLLVRQRPDIQASEALMHAASAQIGVATANLLPQFTLNASYGWETNKIGDLFKNVSNVWTLAGMVAQPIFNGGALRAQRRAAIATFEQTFAQYRQTVLVGFQNVADSLRALENDAKALRAQNAAEAAARQTLALTESQFKLGAVNYLFLLNAQRQYQQTRIARIQAQAARYTDTVALFQALGGGWWNRPEIK